MYKAGEIGYHEALHFVLRRISEMEDNIDAADRQLVAGKITKEQHDALVEDWRADLRYNIRQENAIEDFNDWKVKEGKFANKVVYVKHATCIVACESAWEGKDYEDPETHDSREYARIFDGEVQWTKWAWMLSTDQRNAIKRVAETSKAA